MLTPDEFVRRWQNPRLNEAQIAKQHFLDVCALVDYQMPANGRTEDGKVFQFEINVKKAGGKRGFADVWFQDHFAIEYKTPGEDLDKALNQLRQYKNQMDQPPLLVVCDVNRWEIYANFPGADMGRIAQFTNSDLVKPDIRRKVEHLFYAPNKLRPDRDRVKVTEVVANSFTEIVDSIHQEAQRTGQPFSQERTAHFLTRLVFCLFAEDVDLLPEGAREKSGIFTEIVSQTYAAQDARPFVQDLTQLFEAMSNGGRYASIDIPYFNGALFDAAHVEVLSLGQQARLQLYQACRHDWGYVEPAIFGTLFERILDYEQQRAELGAVYTHREKIEKVVRPVLMQPLERQWATLKAQAQPLAIQLEQASHARERENLIQQLHALRETILQPLRHIKVLDPACGSGNFLYVALGLLLDLEKTILTDPVFADLPREEPQVHPRQLYGIEKNEIAHALATIVVWIGYIQWRQNNGYPRMHTPILQSLGDNIRRADAILAFDEMGAPLEPVWPAVDVIIGNPPFLGKLRQELGNRYVDALFALYRRRVGGAADLVCYWFEKARVQLNNGQVQRVGLIATNSIRGGENNKVIQKIIQEGGSIFMAYDDLEWQGVGVRVSLVGFDKGTEQAKYLNDAPVSGINADLTASVDVTTAKLLPENENLSFSGTKKGGAFDIPEAIALQLLAERNQSGASNRDIVKPWVNGTALVGNPTRNTWIIDFGTSRDEAFARQYEAPFAYVEKHVYPTKSKNRRAARAAYWWLHSEIAPGMRKALAPLSRYIATPRVSKHRFFVWVSKDTLADDGTYVFARDDDYFFGVLHSKIHEVWSLRLGTWLGAGNDPRYTPTTTFETFPLPWSPDHEPVNIGEQDAQLKYQAIATAAHQLHAERQAWLNAEGERDLGTQDRTLTNLYNALLEHRGQDAGAVTKVSARKFAPRLHKLHIALDQAVCTAYGWDCAILEDDEAILRHVLALNLTRAATP